MQRRTVAVLGGGVGGLSAAHELAERGFAVTVYEQRAVFGGKARSIPVPGTGSGGRLDLPGEHGFRFFPGFYKHVTDTMKRIPAAGGRSCHDNLVATSRILLARTGKPPRVWSGRFPRTLDDFRTALHALFDHLDIPDEEIVFFISRLLGFATSCEERWLAEFEETPYWQFIEAGLHSESYQRYLGRGLTRSLVAMRAEDSSTRTVGRILWQLFLDILVPGRIFDRVLNGPTSDVWIDPWRAHLAEDLGVQLVPDAPVRSLNLAGGRLGSVSIVLGGEATAITADYYVAAMPVEVMRALVTPELQRAAPSIARLDLLRTEWMNGIQFFLDSDVPLVDGHQIYLDSNWALTSISQHRFWAGYDLSRYGNGLVNGIVSVDISDWNSPGNFNGMPAMACTSRDEIKDEVWRQLKAALNTDGACRIDDANLLAWSLDPDIQLPNPTGIANLEPLLINDVGSLAHRPDAHTEIANLFLASDYVRTHTDLASMEAANEAARRATNAILQAAEATASPCGLWEFDVPELFRAAQAVDRIRFRAGLPNKILQRHYGRG